MITVKVAIEKTTAVLMTIAKLTMMNLIIKMKMVSAGE